MSWYIELHCIWPLTEKYYNWSGEMFSIKDCLPLNNGFYISLYQSYSKINIKFISMLLKYNNFDNIKDGKNQFEILLSEEELFYASLYPEWSIYKELGIIYEY